MTTEILCEACGQMVSACVTALETVTCERCGQAGVYIPASESLMAT